LDPPVDLELCCPPLLALAPKLLHFSIDVLSERWSSESHAQDVLQLERFLAVCTSLRTLSLAGVGASALGSALSALPSQLAVLTIELTEAEVNGISVYAAFLAALTLPALASLKRWRIDGITTYLAAENGKAEWEQACAERGVEIRGLSYRFIGESLTTLSR
jgi:hypothetical protein